MNESFKQVRALLAAAEELPNSNPRLAILEEAVRVADTYMDVALGLVARRPLMATARSLLRGDILTTAFVWCLGQFDRDPRLFSGWDLFTEYRWVIGQLANLHDVTRPKLEEMLADYGTRLERAGYSPRNFHYARQQLAPDLGDRSMAMQASIEMLNHPRDMHSLDAGWELADQIEIELFVGHVDVALGQAEPYLAGRYYDNGKCDEVCGYLLLPLLERNRQHEAAAIATRCLRSYNPKRVYYWWFGNLLKYAAVSGDLDRAVHWYGECQCAMNPYTDPLHRLHFALDAVVVFDRLVAAGRSEVKLRLPESVPVPHRNGRYPVVDLREWLGLEASEWADRFDTRNGNSYFREQIEVRANLRHLIV